MQHRLQLRPKLGSGQPASSQAGWHQVTAQARSSPQRSASDSCCKRSHISEGPYNELMRASNGKVQAGSWESSQQLEHFQPPVIYPEEFILVKLPPASPVSLTRMLWVDEVGPFLPDVGSEEQVPGTATCSRPQRSAPPRPLQGHTRQRLADAVAQMGLQPVSPNDTTCF